MKTYAIYDEDLKREQAIGYLFCYEKSNSYIIELCEDISEWEAPLLFQSFVKKGIYTIPRDISLLWVKTRVIPSGRQNIGLILKNANLKEYNERALLAITKGRCSQDNCYIREVSDGEIPYEIKTRSMDNVVECYPSEDGQVICLFKDNTARKIGLSQIAEKNKDVWYLLKNTKLLHSVKVGVGGYSIIFNDSIEILKCDLMRKEWLLPISAKDFYNFVHINMVDSSTACDLLQCSRQNLSYLVKTENLNPIVRGNKENLYTKGSIQKLADD